MYSGKYTCNYSVQPSGNCAKSRVELKLKKESPPSAARSDANDFRNASENPNAPGVSARPSSYTFQCRTLVVDILGFLGRRWHTSVARPTRSFPFSY